MTLSFCLPLSPLLCVFLPGLLTSNTKNQAVKKVPMVSKTVASRGNADGLIGDVYRIIDSIVVSGGL